MDWSSLKSKILLRNQPLINKWKKFQLQLTLKLTEEGLKKQGLWALNGSTLRLFGVLTQTELLEKYNRHEHGNNPLIVGYSDAEEFCDELLAIISVVKNRDLFDPDFNEKILLREYQETSLHQFLLNNRGMRIGIRDASRVMFELFVQLDDALGQIDQDLSFPEREPLLHYYNQRLQFVFDNYYMVQEALLTVALS